jgi:hypothetical protein
VKQYRNGNIIVNTLRRVGEQVGGEEKNVLLPGLEPGTLSG